MAADAHLGRRRWTLAASLVTVLVGCGSGGSSTGLSPSSTLDPVCGAAPPGSQVVLYTSPGLEYWYSEVLTTFESDCDVSVYYAHLTNQQVLQRLALERHRPLADIAVAQAPYISQAAAAGLLAGTDVPAAAAVPASRCGHRRMWCTVAETYTSWVDDPKVVPTPQTWEDLLAPPFAGKILTSRPDRSEDGLALLNLLILTEGEAQALAYLRRLEAATHAHYTLADTMSRLVATGSALAANGNLQEDLNDIDQYHNLAVWFPTDPGSPRTTLAIPFGASLVAGGRNPVVARALLDFMWSAEGQSGTGLSNAAPGRPDVVPGDARSIRLRSTLAGITVQRIDWDAEAARQQALIAAWRPLERAPDGTAPPSYIPIPSLPPAPPSPG